MSSFFSDLSLDTYSQILQVETEPKIPVNIVITRLLLISTMFVNLGSEWHFKSEIAMRIAHEIYLL